MTCLTIALATMVALQDAAAQKDDSRPIARPNAALVQAGSLTAEAARYLIAAQEKEGGWASQTGPGITCLVLKALIDEPTVGPKHAAVLRGVTFVAGFQRDDGGIYAAEGMLKSYETSVALSLFSALEQEDFAKRIGDAQAFLKDNQ
ncbi:MAG: hypothetical protein IID33_16810, partial [Planctomycetes bacterium]|nr:hypothetical protein [Planctomycetota bacterium]